jgi:hypothetical protein
MLECLIRSRTDRLSRDGRAGQLQQLFGALVGEDLNTYRVFVWPLVAVHLDPWRAAEAMAASRLMVHPAQLPHELEMGLVKASGAWDRGAGRGNGGIIKPGLEAGRCSSASPERARLGAGTFREPLYRKLS